MCSISAFVSVTLEDHTFSLIEVLVWMMQGTLKEGSRGKYTRWSEPNHHLCFDPSRVRGGNHGPCGSFMSYQIHAILQIFQVSMTTWNDESFILLSSIASLPGGFYITIVKRGWTHQPRRRNLRWTHQPRTRSSGPLPWGSLESGEGQYHRIKFYRQKVVSTVCTLFSHVTVL